MKCLTTCLAISTLNFFLTVNLIILPLHNFNCIHYTRKTLTVLYECQIYNALLLQRVSTIAWDSEEVGHYSAVAMEEAKKVRLVQ